MSDKEDDQLDRCVRALERIGATADQVTQLVTQAQAIVESAGGVQGIKDKIAFLNTFIPSKK